MDIPDQVAIQDQVDIPAQVAQVVTQVQVDILDQVAIQDPPDIQV